MSFRKCLPKWDWLYYAGAMTVSFQRAEFVLKTDSGYPKDAGVTLFTLEIPSAVNTHRSAPPVSALAHSRGLGAQQAEGLQPRTSRAPLAVSQTPCGLPKKTLFHIFFGLNHSNWEKNGMSRLNTKLKNKIIVEVTLARPKKIGLLAQPSFFATNRIPPAQHEFGSKKGF